MAASFVRVRRPIQAGVIRGSWSLGGATKGAWIEIPKYTDKTIQFAGTWDSATAIAVGSDDPRCLTDPDNADKYTLTDAQGNAISKTANAGEVIQENPRFMRVETSGGDQSGAGTTDLVAYLTARKA